MANELWGVPTPVQDLAAGGAAPVPPNRYVLRDQDRHGGLHAADEIPEPIPLIDLSRLPSDDEAAKLRAALQSWGLLLATNHGVEASLLDDVMRAGREFFLLPPEEKKKYSNMIDGKHFQKDGYGHETVRSEDQILDWLDRLRLTLEPEDERDYTLCPSRPESFRDLLNDYTSKTKKLRDRILREISKLLEIDVDYFVNHVNKDQAITFARFAYYPACARPDLVFGIRPHSDGRLLTIILVDEHVGGLQVQKDGKWYNVQTMPDTLLVVLGDSMQIMSNGIFESSVHRVVTNDEKDRISLSVFYGVPGETMLEPVPSSLDKDRPARYKKMKAEDYIRIFEEHHSRGERLIHSMKI
ncbi:unnamed protein product [Alopecurus aequalis]